MENFSPPGKRGSIAVGLLLRMVLWLAGIYFPLTASSASAIFTQTGLPELLQQSYVYANTLPAIESGPRNRPALIVFFDPVCPLGAKEWQALQAYREQLHIRWVPVGAIDPHSEALSALILSDEHPVLALAHNEARLLQSPASPRAATPAPTLYALSLVRNNTHYWQRNFGVLPLLLYPSQTGIHALYGRASAAELQQIAQTVLAFGQRKARPQNTEEER
ncbi:hypothetical protein [Acidithiobacillus sp. AMEEHan]|uniref:hypothetical protein n=1 Tax=Acidithiobacillus sp. AMEEHan TaxID=2994951 RepID=UPI0027E54626|nr:hypothetical protein [Acidithiobacillus sp. AMEEHan]